MNSIKNREEFLFIYDVTDANPNGDPMDDNKPRIDEETGVNIVTDVRLKRTIRDFLFNFKGYNGENGKDIFIREKSSEEGFILDVKTRLKEFPQSDDPNSQKYIKGEKIKKAAINSIVKAFQESILKQCIDSRMFGAVYPIEFPASIIEDYKQAVKSSIKLTGPIQFKMGRSLHKVSLKNIGHSFSMSSGDEKRSGSLAPEYLLSYSIIAFYGIINENAAKATGLTDSDVAEFYEAMWEGTKNLISRSKMGHMPRLLLRLKHKKPHFFIGDLDKLVKLKRNEDINGDEKIRSVEDFSLDLSLINGVINSNKDSIDSISLKTDNRLSVSGWDQK